MPKKKKDKSVSLDTMDEKKTKGLSDEELVKKYGDKKAPGFNEALRNTGKTGKYVKVDKSTPPKGITKR